MRRIPVSILILILLYLTVTGVQCKKNDKENTPLSKSKQTDESVQAFLKNKIGTARFNQLPYEKRIIYHLYQNIVAVRIPLHHAAGRNEYILVADDGNQNWFGNYVTVEKTDSVFNTIRIITTSFDSLRTEINGGAASRPAVLSGNIINLGVPGIQWLSFISSLQQPYPVNIQNWYYPENATNTVNTGGGGGGNNTIYYDPYIADNLVLDKKLRDSFPCIVNLIDTLSSSGNLNQRAQRMLNELFNVGKKIHLTLQVNELGTIDSLDAVTKVDSAWTTTMADGSEGLDFYAKISLNKWLLKNATKEYIASTIVHEAYHAYIAYKYLQYRRGIIDSTAFKTLFPLYWPPRTLPGTGIYINPSSMLQHQVMAANLIEDLASPLWALSNNSMSPQMKDSLYRSLSWGGLGETTAWRSKTDSCSIMAINRAARDTSRGMGQSNGPFMLSNCGTTYTFSYRSLNFKMPCK